MFDLDLALAFDVVSAAGFEGTQNGVGECRSSHVATVRLQQGSGFPEQSLVFIFSRSCLLDCQRRLSQNLRVIAYLRLKLL